MARTTQITREALVDAGVRLVLEKGLEALNARSLAAQAGCSIQPVCGGAKSILRLYFPASPVIITKTAFSGMFLFYSMHQLLSTEEED